MRRLMKFEGLETRKLMTADVGIIAPVDCVEHVEVAGREEHDGDVIHGQRVRQDTDDADGFDDAEQWHGFLSDVAF